jgi:hypothetical protein
MSANFVFVINLNAFNEVTNLFEPLLGSLDLTSCDDVHVDLTCVWIGSSLLESVLDEPDCFIDISFLNNVAQSHFG